MSKSKEEFSRIREEQIAEDYIQDILFILGDEEEAYEKLKKEANQELGKILVEKEKDGIKNSEGESTRSSSEVLNSETSFTDTISRSF